MLKQIVILTSFFSNILALEHQLMIRVPREHEHLRHAKQSENYLSLSDTQLVRSFEANEMRWVSDMYDVSGFTDDGMSENCMSRECFMVNALEKIRECMENTRCCPGLQDCVEQIRDCSSPECCEVSLLGINFVSSFAALTMTLIAGASGPNKPWKFPEQHVQTACTIAEGLFNYTAGREWVHNCIAQSMKTDHPCNVTAAREAFNKNGGYYYDAPACCYDKADPICYQEGLRYNKEIYPGLHSQAVWDCWKPFMIAAPTVVALQVAILAGYRLRRYWRERAPQPFRVTTDQPLLIEAELVE